MLVHSHTPLWKVVTNPVRKREHWWRSKVERMTGQRLKNLHLVCRLTVVTQFGCLSLMMSHSNGYWKLVIFLSFSLLHDPQIPELLLNPLRSRPLGSLHWTDPSHCLTGHSILRLQCNYWSVRENHQSSHAVCLSNPRNVSRRWSVETTATLSHNLFIITGVTWIYKNNHW